MDWAHGHGPGPYPERSGTGRLRGGAAGEGVDPLLEEGGAVGVGEGAAYGGHEIRVALAHAQPHHRTAVIAGLDQVETREGRMDGGLVADVLVHERSRVAIVRGAIARPGGAVTVR